MVDFTLNDDFENIIGVVLLGMEHEKENINQVKPETPPAYLFGRIMKRIGIERKLALSKKRAAYFSFAFAGSLAAFFATLLTLSGALIQSELAKFFSVIFSDPMVAAANWQDFGLFFLESLPVTYLVIFLAALFALLQSVKYAAKNFADVRALLKVAKQN